VCVVIIRYYRYIFNNILADTSAIIQETPQKRESVCVRFYSAAPAGRSEPRRPGTERAAPPRVRASRAEAAAAGHVRPFPPQTTFRSVSLLPTPDNRRPPPPPTNQPHPPTPRLPYQQLLHRAPRVLRWWDGARKPPHPGSFVRAFVRRHVLRVEPEKNPTHTAADRTGNRNGNGTVSFPKTPPPPPPGESGRRCAGSEARAKVLQSGQKKCSEVRRDVPG